MKVIISLSSRFLLKISLGNWNNNLMFTITDMQSGSVFCAGIGTSKTSFGSQRAGT